MLPKKPRRMDHTTLIWEYLDGDTTPTRLDRLSQLLSQRPKVRDQFVESALLHGMLCSFFKEQSADQTSASRDHQVQKPRRRDTAA